MRINLYILNYLSLGGQLRPVLEVPGEHVAVLIAGVVGLQPLGVQYRVGIDGRENPWWPVDISSTKHSPDNHRCSRRCICDCLATTRTCTLEHLVLFFVSYFLMSHSFLFKFTKNIDLGTKQSFKE